jgi:hypothetical protein
MLLWLKRISKDSPLHMASAVNLAPGRSCHYGTAGQQEEKVPAFGVTFRLLLSAFRFLS